MLTGLNSEISRILCDLRSKIPLVQCITNHVTSNLVANAVIAVGGSPAMVDTVGEADSFAKIADALLINLGTPTIEQREAMVSATAQAVIANKPWVLDPVAVGVLSLRSELAQNLLAYSPRVIRGNASEILALAGADNTAKGVDAGDSVTIAESFATQLSVETGAVVAISGPIDIIIKGDKKIEVKNGNELLSKITGAGCALGGVVAAFNTVTDNCLLATALAHGYYGVAAELAANKAEGPASFQVGLLDNLANLTTEIVLAKLELSYGD